MIASLFIDCVLNEHFTEALRLIEFFPYDLGINNILLYAVCHKLSGNVKELTKAIQLADESTSARLEKILPELQMPSETSLLKVKLLEIFAFQKNSDIYNETFKFTEYEFESAAVKATIDKFHISAAKMERELFVAEDFQAFQKSIPIWLHATTISDLAIAKALINRSRHNEALKYFERAYLHDPLTVNGKDYYSTALWHTNDRQKLANLAHETALHFPLQVESAIIRGNYYSLLGNHEGAVECFSLAGELDPNYTYSSFLEGHDLLTLGNTESAELTFDRVLRTDPNSFFGHFGLGIVSYKKGKLHEALGFFQKSLELNPVHSSIICYLAMIYEQMGHYEKALDVLDRLARHDVQLSALAYYKKLHLLRRCGNEKGAISLVSEAVEFSPADPAIRYCRAELLRPLSSGYDSLKAFRRVLEVDPSNVAVKEVLERINF